jgi:sugar lactone lactonase YvrE
MRGNFFGCLLSALTIFFCTAAHADWLSDQHRGDGSIATSSDVATSFQATAEAIRTFRVLGRTADIGTADSYLSSQVYQGTEYLARKIVASADAGLPVPGLVAELLTHQNADGGFGELSGYNSTTLDTGFALEALTASGNADTPSAAYGVNYLLQKQRSDGGWGDAVISSDIYTTAILTRTLYAYRSKFAAVTSVVANANNFLLSQRAIDYTWGEQFLTAQTLLTLSTSLSDNSILQQSATALRSAQLSNGSWLSDVYATALALRALRVFDTQVTTIPSAVGGTIAGYVQRAQSSEPLANALITLAGTSGVTVRTNAEGYFALNGVSSGDQTLIASKDGFVSASKAVSVRNGQLSNAGNIYLTQNVTTAVLSGAVIDSANQLPLGGVDITLSGPSTISSKSTADGSFEFSALTVGHYSILLHKQGYSDLIGQFDAAAGGVLAMQQAMTPEGTYLDNSIAALGGNVQDGATGQIIAGAQLVLDDATTATAASDGSFTFNAIGRGTHQLLISANGYRSVAYAFTFAPGARGDLGTLKLYPSVASPPATSLSILGKVVDSVDSHVLTGATVTVAGQTLVTDAEGRFTVNGLSTLAFSFVASAAQHETRTFSGTATAFGEVAITLVLPPAGGSDAATSTTVHGVVRASGSNSPIVGAKVEVQGSALSATTGADGGFNLAGISSLKFTLQTSAANFGTVQYPVEVTRHGNYAIDVTLTAAASTSGLQIYSFDTLQTGTGANTQQSFVARVANLSASVQTAVVLIDVVDASGAVVATISPYLPQTTTLGSLLSFAANETVAITVPWNTAQFSPGQYRLLLRLVQNGSISRDVPKGNTLAQASTYANISATRSVNGQFASDPPLTQAGSVTPVKLSALLINTGNLPLTGTTFTLTVKNASSAVLYSVQSSLVTLNVSGNTSLDFGTWIPTTTGNLNITVTPVETDIVGAITGSLYVGDKANGAFTVNKTVVPLGTQTVHGSVALQGVDVRTTTSTDPLFVAVKEAVRKGGLFVGPQVQQWNQTNRCMGCHIQTQSFNGLSAAMDKADIDKSSVQYLYNDIVGSMQADGVLAPAYVPYFPQTQTSLGIWALSDWHDARQVFRTLYRAGVFQLSRMNTSGNQSWWTYDHCSVWVCNTQGQTMSTVKGLTAALRMSSEIGATPVNDYVFDDTGFDFGVTNMMGVQQGPDGWIWFVDGAGTLSEKNLQTQATRVIATGLGSPAIGLAIRPDGTAYVSTTSALTKIAPDGTKSTILSGSGVSALWDVALGPDGALYVADSTKIWRITADDQATQFVAGGLLNRPTGLSFDQDGNLFVSNYAAWNILKITPAGVVSVFSDGLPFQPIWLKRAADGILYAASQRYSNNGTAPAGVFRFDANGYVERLPLFDAANDYGYNALANIGGDIFVHRANDHHLYKLRVTTQDTSQLGAMRTAVGNAARYTLATYADNNSYNDIHAMRLVTLAEARTQITDAALQGQIDAAINDIVTLLRARQRTDGGWAYTIGAATSDPYTTAFVGLALEYTNPSVNDPVIRNSISYLLNTQTADGSWPYQSGVFTTKLGPTSFVMAYMPKALERLGGIDTDLNLALPANVQLSNPSLAPTSQTTNSSGGASYKWSLQGVTAQTRKVEFDLTLQNMTYQESRAVASSAYLEFANSFNSEKLRADIDIPRVSATSDLALYVTTAQAGYAANTDVAISSKINNLGPAITSGQVHLYIKAADGTTVADLGASSFGALATNGLLSIPAVWNTGTYLVGGYKVVGQLYNQSGQLVFEDTADFAVSHATTVVNAGVTTDKPTYQAWDTVNLNSRIRNLSANAIQPAGIAEVTVTSPAGKQLFFASYPFDDMVPGSLRSLTDALKLADAATGDYPVSLVVKDGATRAVVATAGASFHVLRDDIQALSGTVKAANTRVSQGDSNLCTDTVSNLSSIALPGVRLTRTLVNLTTGAVVSSDNVTLNFSAKQQQALPRSIATAGLSVGGYACVLSAAYNNSTKQLGSAGFDIVASPVRIESSLQIGTRGRLLVLMDDSDAKPCAPIKDIELWTPFHTPLPADAKVDVELQDANGTRIDMESVALSQYRGAINKSVGKGADLTITGISADVLTVTVSGATKLNGGYRVVATANGASLPAMVVDTGTMGTSCGWPVGVGTHFGDFNCSKVHLPTGAPAPTPPAPEPSLSTQRTFLESQLKTAGWSYKIVNEDEDFEREFKTGAYSQYALFAGRQKLDEDTQKALREAVNMGAGLLDAGEHDLRQHGFDAALGITPSGSQPQATGINILSSALSPGGSATLAYRQEALRATLKGATAVAAFTGVPVATNAAVTTYAYGRGKSVYVGYDILAEATQAGDGSLQASLLRTALEYVKPGFTQNTTSQVVPIRITLTNKGMTTAGQVVLPLPTGVSLVDAGSAISANNILTWTYSLAVDQTITMDAWVRLPATSGAVVFDAVIKTSNAGAYVDYGHARLTINATSIATLADTRALAASNVQFLIPKLWLGYAQFWLDRGCPKFAVLALLQATDGTISNPHPQAPILRLEIDQVIWDLNRGL